MINLKKQASDLMDNIWIKYNVTHIEDIKTKKYTSYYCIGDKYFILDKDKNNFIKEINSIPTDGILK